ncbi:hypothetical protein FXW78_06955 [Rhodococcus opacus]|nr:hypothetical protein [Rhodococcus opacus]RZK96041.1 MAG: hypothetical protein EOP30_01860 [Rhodococcus sp. (in: high G+C Gram-positive bacteria)]
MPKTSPVVDVSAPICCAPVSAAPMADDAALHLALRLEALADPVRITLMSSARSEALEALRVALDPHCCT